VPTLPASLKTFKDICLYHPHLQHEVSQVPYFLKTFYGLLILPMFLAFLAAAFMTIST